MTYVGNIILRWVIPMCCASVFGAAVTYFGLFRRLRDGIQCLLRSNIIQMHDKYQAREYCPVYARETLTRAYRAYHGLKGNDVATDLYEDTMRLPTEPPENRQNGG